MSSRTAGAEKNPTLSDLTIAFLRLTHNLFHPLDDIRRLMNNFFRQRFEPLAAHRRDLPLALVRLGDEFRILQHIRIGVAQKFNAIGRDTRRR